MSRLPLTPFELRQAGIKVLLDHLGPANTARFLWQFSAGSGDYTLERRAWLDSVSLEDLVRDIEQLSAAGDDESKAE
jgi:hypothetical protein